MEKTEAALNQRIASIQAQLRTTQSETAQKSLFQALLVCLAVSEALTDFMRSVGEYARNRHSDLKRAEADLTARHAALLDSGGRLLEQLKANPANQALRKEIDRTQRDMEAIEKTLRRSTNAFQADVAPGMRMIEEVAVTIRRFSEADQIGSLKRVVKLMVGHAYELYRSQPGVPAKGIVDAVVWEKAAVAGVDEATEFQAAFAHAGYQVLLTLEVMGMALIPGPPQTTDEATRRATEAIAVRMKTVASRLTS